MSENTERTAVEQAQQFSDVLVGVACEIGTQLRVSGVPEGRDRGVGKLEQVPGRLFATLAQHGNRLGGHPTCVVVALIAMP